MVCHALLQGIFLTQGSNLGLLHGRQILYRLSHQGREYKTNVMKLKKNKNKTLASLGQITWECGKYWGNGM